MTGPSGGAGVAVPGIRLLYQDAGGLDADLDRVAELGVRWLRVDAAWSEIEASRGAFDYSRLDRAVRGARARNLEVLLVLSTTAAWARPAGTDWNHGPTTAAERAGFAAFSAATARRYRGDVAAYEVWNEPNLPIAWAPKPNAADYLALLKTAYPAVKRADPKAVVMTGGTGGGQTGIGTMPWYRRLYAGGMRAHCDAVAIHPYPDAPVAASGEMALAPKVRALMDANGDADKRLWGTETGAPTAGRPAIDEPRQAILLRQLYQRWARLKNAGPLLYYTLEDHGGTDREGHFGLLRVDRSRKPAYAALRDWTGAG